MPCGQGHYQGVGPQRLGNDPVLHFIDHCKAGVEQIRVQPLHEFGQRYFGEPDVYLNLHRPCLFAEERTDAKGKVVKRYPQHLVQTPLEKLASMSPACRNLRPETTLQALQVQARVMSDNEAADQLQKARSALF
ncbi:MAG: hypothetical protein BGO72_12680 [Burkholderiales bacterium 70-64]|nr:MAG: hypothetical protein BGO72_12680 [Burkholderiales bacterium 70-64]